MKDRTHRILIVDPDSLFAEKLSVMLCSKGYDVEITDGITRAAQRLKDVSFGCVIMDEGLPEMRGYDAVPVLKAISPATQIIMTATRNTAELESRIRQEDIFFYYVKTFDMHELEMAVRDAFRKIAKAERSGARIGQEGSAPCSNR